MAVRLAFIAAVSSACCSPPTGAGFGDEDPNWTKRLTSWGYAVVLVDSYDSRGTKDTCADPTFDAARVADALWGSRVRR